MDRNIGNFLCNFLWKRSLGIGILVSIKCDIEVNNVNKESLLVFWLIGVQSYLLAQSFILTFQQFNVIHSASYRRRITSFRSLTWNICITVYFAINFLCKPCNDSSKLYGYKFLEQSHNRPWSFQRPWKNFFVHRFCTYIQNRVTRNLEKTEQLEMVASNYSNYIFCMLYVLCYLWSYTWEVITCCLYIFIYERLNTKV